MAKIESNSGICRVTEAIDKEMYEYIINFGGRKIINRAGEYITLSDKGGRIYCKLTFVKIGVIPGCGERKPLAIRIPKIWELIKKSKNKNKIQDGLEILIGEISESLRFSICKHSDSCLSDYCDWEILQSDTDTSYQCYTCCECPFYNDKNSAMMHDVKYKSSWGQYEDRSIYFI
jgi:hypothetical protein